MVTFAEFYTKGLNGTTPCTLADSIIPMKVRQAVKWMESQHTFLYMEKFGTVSIPAGTRNLGLQLGLRVCSLENHKGRWKLSLPSKISPKDADTIDTAMPKAIGRTRNLKPGLIPYQIKHIPLSGSYVEFYCVGLPDTSPEVLQLNEQIIFRKLAFLFPQLSVMAVWRSAPKVSAR